MTTSVLAADVCRLAAPWKYRVKLDELDRSKSCVPRSTS